MKKKIKKRIEFLKSYYLADKQSSTNSRRCVELVIEELENLLKENKWQMEIPQPLVIN